MIGVLSRQESTQSHTRIDTGYWVPAMQVVPWDAWRFNPNIIEDDST